jgi:hypothetical protein
VLLVALALSALAFVTIDNCANETASANICHEITASAPASRAIGFAERPARLGRHARIDVADRGGVHSARATRVAHFPPGAERLQL